MLFLLAFCFNAKAQNKVMFSDVPAISYCELINNAEEYDQKFVRVKATYSRGFESSIFYDESCKNNEASWVDFTPAHEKNTHPYFLKKMRKLFKRSDQRKNIEIELVIVGKFDGKRRISIFKTPAQTLTFSVGYGHLDSFDYQLTVLKIEEVKPVEK